MPKIVIVGSCKYAPYEILITPNPQDKELYETDHEKAYEEACKVFYPKIDECDEVWIYTPDGIIGKHTKKDIRYADGKGKIIRILVAEGWSYKYESEL